MTTTLDSSIESRRAIHEAAHAVVGYLRGCRIKDVRLHDAGPYRGTCTLTYADETSADDRLLVGLAGSEAVRTFFPGYPVGDSLDRDDALAIAADVNEDDPVGVLDQAADAVTAVIGRAYVKRAVEKVASRLLAKKHIGHQDVAALFREANDELAAEVARQFAPPPQKPPLDGPGVARLLTDLQKRLNRIRRLVEAELTPT